MKKKGIKIIIALILFIIAMLINFNSEIINKIIFLVAYIIVGFEIVRKALRNIIRGKVFDENFLMTVATIGAFGIGEFPEAVAVMLFYQVGELFQSYAVDKSRKSIANLMDIRPDFANIEKDGKIQKVDPDDVKIGDIIVVKPGEKIPLDGIVIDGNSSIDTKALTGESLPKEIEKGDLFLAINKGHDYINEAIKNGAVAIICEKHLDIPSIKVDDSILALGQIAHYIRSLYNIPLIAITGSVGKTTTKELKKS